MQIALFEMKKIDQGPTKKVVIPNMFVIYSTPNMRSPVTMGPKIFWSWFSISQFHEILSSFISILCWTKQKYLSKKFWLHKGFDSNVIFSNFMCIGWNFWNFFFQLLLPGKTLHVSQGIFAKKFWTYFLLLTVWILEYFFSQIQSNTVFLIHL